MTDREHINYLDDLLFKTRMTMRINFLAIWAFLLLGATMALLGGCAPEPQIVYVPCNPCAGDKLAPTQGTIDALGGLARTATTNSAPTSNVHTIWILK